MLTFTACRVATGQGKVREIQGQGKVMEFKNFSMNFVESQGNRRKVWEI